MERMKSTANQKQHAVTVAQRVRALVCGKGARFPGDLTVAVREHASSRERVLWKAYCSSSRHPENEKNE